MNSELGKFQNLGQGIFLSIINSDGVTYTVVIITLIFKNFILINADWKFTYLKLSPEQEKFFLKNL